MRTCKLSNCDKKHKGHGLCHTHLSRFKKHGSTDKPPINKSKITHGMYGTVEYNTWARMKYRCNNPKSQDWYRYGGRGIKVCERWDNFENFYKDMGERPSPKHSLDRIDNNKNYSPENCRWATIYEQANNKNRNHYIIVDGKKVTLAQVARGLGMNYGTFRDRIYSGYSIVKAMDKPIDQRFKPKNRRAA